MSLKNYIIIAGTTAALSSAAFGQQYFVPVEKTKRDKQESGFDSKLWKASLATYVGANTMDLASGIRLSNTQGLRETNPLMRNTASSIAVKGVIVGIVLATQWVILRHNPNAAKTMALLNFGASSLPAYASAHNFSLK